MLSRNNRSSHGSDGGNSTSRVNRTIFPTEIGNYYRNRPASISTSTTNTSGSASFMKKCYYFLWIMLLIAVAGVTVVVFQAHLDNTTSNSSSSFSSLQDYFNTIHHQDTNDYLRKPGKTDIIHTEPPIALPPKSSNPSNPPLSPPEERNAVVTRPPYDRSMFKEIHFVHIPKCGGTTMTGVLRQIQCLYNPEQNKDCCLNPGFCDWHAHRRCEVIKGCINHFPNRKLIMKSLPPSFVVFREPISRILSAWFYRGHSPNNDFFQVRKEFKDIRDGKRPKVTFDEYIEMPEYQNIQTRMLGADSFPYRNITITDEIFRKAIEAVDHFYFIGLQEEFDLSAKAFARAIIVNDSAISITKEREQNTNNKVKKDKQAIKSNTALMARLREVNHYDVKLYEHVVERFCEMIRQFPDLYNEVKQNQRVNCPE